MIQFGPGGNCEWFKAEGNKTSDQMPAFLQKIGLEAYEDSSKLHGLWINGNRSKGYRFLPGGIMWAYSGDSSDKGKWKCPGNNAFYMMDSIGFTETKPFAIVGTNVLILNGVLYYKAQ